MKDPELELDNPPAAEYGDDHEVAFLGIYTTKGVIVCQTHNEHNGYYGGFSLDARLCNKHGTRTGE